MRKRLVIFHGVWMNRLWIYPTNAPSENVEIHPHINLQKKRDPVASL